MREYLQALTLPDILGIVVLVQLLLGFWIVRAARGRHQALSEESTRAQDTLTDRLHQTTLSLHQAFQTGQQDVQERLVQGHLETHKLVTETLQRQMADMREQMHQSFKMHASGLTSHVQTLNEEVRNQLHALTQQVNHKLAEGFEKTSSTFTDVVRRLTIIDEAQKKISELSSHVVSLQDVLVDKRSRGAFGEVQLASLVTNMIPSGHYEMQYTLSNQKRADCVLFLPEPTGMVVIDAKFPLETFQKLNDAPPGSAERKTLQQQFRVDMQKHIRDIAQKYIIPNETSDGAMLFIPAEVIFAEVHANYSDIVSLSQRERVWMVSPTTLMAVLTTAKAVLKDDATRKQIHIIQQHLVALAEDFQRFEKRMEKLTRHIDMAQQDASEVNTSARKITQRFQKIESVELDKKEALLTE